MTQWAEQVSRLASEYKLNTISEIEIAFQMYNEKQEKENQNNKLKEIYRFLILKNGVGGIVPFITNAACAEWLFIHRKDLVKILEK